jgi:hypothetical protein
MRHHREHRGGQAEGCRVHRQLPRRLSHQLNIRRAERRVHWPGAPPCVRNQDHDQAFHRSHAFRLRRSARSVAQRSTAARATDGGQSFRAECGVLLGAKEGAEGLRIETRQVGNLGAKLSIWVDRSRERLFSRILTADDRKFGDDGARCRLIFPRGGPDYSRFVVAFKRGKTVHVEVQNAAVMQMSNAISLAGFSRRLGSGT